MKNSSNSIFWIVGTGISTYFFANFTWIWNDSKSSQNYHGRLFLFHLDLEIGVVAGWKKSRVSCFVSPPKIGIYEIWIACGARQNMTCESSTLTTTFAEIQTYLETSSKISVQKITTTINMVFIFTVDYLLIHFI